MIAWTCSSIPWLCSLIPWDGFLDRGGPAKSWHTQIQPSSAMEEAGLTSTLLWCCSQDGIWEQDPLLETGILPLGAWCVCSSYTNPVTVLVTKQGKSTCGPASILRSQGKLTQQLPTPEGKGDPGLCACFPLLPYFKSAIRGGICLKITRKTQELQLVQELRSWEGAWEADFVPAGRLSPSWPLEPVCPTWEPSGNGGWDAGRVASVAWTFNKGRKSGSRSRR